MKGREIETYTLEFVAEVILRNIETHISSGNVEQVHHCNRYWKQKAETPPLKCTSSMHFFSFA